MSTLIRFDQRDTAKSSKLSKDKPQMLDMSVSVKFTSQIWNFDALDRDCSRNGAGHWITLSCVYGSEVAEMSDQLAMWTIVRA